MRTSKIAVIVDPYSSGALYESEFAKHGVKCIGIQSSHLLPAHFVQDLDRSKYTEVLCASPNLTSRLCVQDIVAVVAGCDTGVALADDLAQSLGVLGNDPSKSATRRYKDQMHEALKLRGLRHIDTAAFESLEEFLTRSDEFNSGTFVIKPINSAGSEGVRFAEGRRGVVEAMRASAWGQDNVLGDVNSGFVIQPFISGGEYVVDMVATGDGFFVASVCRDERVEVCLRFRGSPRSTR